MTFHRITLKGAHCVEPLEARIAPATIFVTTNADSGPGSLRQAILDANSASYPGQDLISFANIPAGPFVIQPLTPLPTITEALLIDGYTAPGASVNTSSVGTNAVLRVELDGALLSNGHGLILGGPGGSTVEGLNIRGFHPAINDSGHGIVIRSDNNVVAGNYIGTDVSGLQAMGNANAAVSVGLFTGTGAFRNNLIGGSTPADRNILSGGAFGILISNDGIDTRVEGNLIGTDKTGTNPIPNHNVGVAVGGIGTVIGGSGIEARNVISGNDGTGIAVSGINTLIVGNYIGLNAAGDGTLGNARSGILFSNGATRATVGGSSVNQRNVISGNLGSGIEVGSSFGDGAADEIRIFGNRIGTDPTGVNGLGNAKGGIAIYGTRDTIIGGTQPGQGNTVLYNGGSGVFLSPVAGSVTGVRISGNSIHSNMGLEIDLQSQNADYFGVNINDPLDVDGGANGLLNWPKLDSVSNTGGNVTINATVSAESNRQYYVEFFALAPNQADPSGHGGGAVFLGSTLVSTDGSGAATAGFSQQMSLPANTYFSAVLIDAISGNTSEFGNAIGPAATYTWTGAQSADWFQAGNWAPNGVPGPLDKVIYNGGTNPMVLDAQVAVAEFTHNGGALAGAGNLIVRESFVWGGGVHSGLSVVVVKAGMLGGPAPLQWTRGQLIIAGDTTVVGGGIVMNEGNITVDGTLTLNAGVIDQDGPGSNSQMTVYGTLTKVGTGVFGIDLQDLSNLGTIQSNAGSLILSHYQQFDGFLKLNGGDVASAQPLVLVGGVLEGTGTVNGVVNNDSAIVRPGGLGAVGKLTITSQYTQGLLGALDIEVGGTAAALEYDQLDTGVTALLDGSLKVHFINGYVPALGDTLSVVTASNVAGEFADVTGAGAMTVSYGNNSVQLIRNGATFTWDGGGFTDTSWNNPTNWAPDGVPGVGDRAILNTSATITIAGVNIIVGDFIQSAGVLTGGGDLTVMGSLQWSGGTQSGSGLTLSGTGSVTILDGATPKVLDGRTLRVVGSGVNNGPGPLVIDSGGVLLVGGSVFEFSGATPFQAGANGGRIQVDPDAVLRKLGTTNIDVPVGLNLSVHGTLEVAQGELTIRGDGNSGFAVYEIMAGAALNFNAASYGFGGNATFEGGGTVRLQGGLITGTDAFMEVEAGTTFSVEGGQLLADSATLISSGTFNWSGGTIAGLSSASIQGLFNFTGSTPKTLQGWEFRFEDSALGMWSGSGGISLEQDARIEMNGKVSLSGDFGLTNTDGSAPELDIVPGGSFRVDGGASQISFPVTNAGQLTVENGGVLTLVKGLIQTSGAVAAGAGASIITGQPIELQGGKLYGVGTIVGMVNNTAGIVSPGPGLQGTGILTITGDYVQGGLGTLEIEIGGSNPGNGYDQLHVGGSAAMDGSLILNVVNGFVVGPAADFAALVADGTFTGVISNFSSSDPTLSLFYPGDGMHVVRNALVYIWDGGGGADTNWFNPLNWDLDSGVPGLADVAVLDVGQTITIPTNVSVASFQQSSGTVIKATGVTFTILTAFGFAGGVQGGPGTTVLDATGSMIMTGGTFETGQFRLEGDGLIQSDVRIENGGTLGIAGTLRLDGDWRFDTGTSGAMQVEQGGLIRKLSGIGISEIEPAIGFTNNGTVQVEDGTFKIDNATGGDGAVFSPLASTTLEIAGGSAVFTGTTNHGTGGTLLLSGGNLQFQGSVNVTYPGALLAVETDVTLNGTLSISSGVSFELRGGTISGNGGLDLNGSFEWTGGAVAGSGSFAIGTSAVASISGANAKMLTGRTLSNQGLLGFSGTGALVLNGGVIDNAGTIQMDTDASIEFGGGNPAIGNQSGAFWRKDGTGTTSAIGNGIAFTNNGSVEIIGGTLSVGNLYTQMSGFTTLLGGELLTTGTITINGGVLGGTGAITGSVMNADGVVAPGFSPGKIQIFGNFEQQSGGVLEIELQGTDPAEIDTLEVIGGSVVLGGTLNVATLGGFIPPPASVFPVVIGNTSGNFAAVNLPGGLGLNVNANGVNVVGPADPLTVTTVDDSINANDGVISLREAITYANLNPGLDTISFNIPSSPGAVQTIFIGFELPAITDPVVIDGYTQPGAVLNGSSPGNGAIILIELNGQSAGVANGLILSGGGSTVKGLAIGNFSESGIRIESIGGNIISGNYIGTDATGAIAHSNGLAGVEILTDSNMIGGGSLADQNIISGNQVGVVISGIQAHDNFVQNNLIGTSASGLGVLGNALAGVLIQNSDSNQIGGTGSTEGNAIRFNSGPGISVIGTARRNVIVGNSIDLNLGSGIDLGGDGFTPNDGAPDADTGPNDLINFPDLTATFDGGGGATVSGTINGVPNTTMRIELFAGTNPDGNGVVQGARFLGFTDVLTNGVGGATFIVNVSGLVAGELITATASNLFDAGTSEFAVAAGAPAGVPTFVNAKTPFTFLDASGDQIRVTLKGSGSAAVLLHAGFPTGADIASIELFDTDLKSQLSVVMLGKNRAGSTIGQVFTHDALQHMGTIALGDGVTLGNGIADTIPDLHVSGKLLKLEIDRIAPNTFIKLGDTLPYNITTDNKTPDTINNRPSLTVGAVLGPGFVLEVIGTGIPQGVGGGGLGNVVFGFWQDPGYIRTTQSIGNFTIKSGNFYGVLEVDKFHVGEGTTADMGSINVQDGAWGSSGTEVEGNIESFNVGEFLDGASITAGSIGKTKTTSGGFNGTLTLTSSEAESLPTFTVNSDFSGKVVSANPIKRLVIKGDFMGSLEAPSIGGIKAFAFQGTEGATSIVGTMGIVGLLKSTSGVFHDYDIVSETAFSGLSVKLANITASTVGVDNVHITALSVGNISVKLTAGKSSSGVNLVGIQNSEFITTGTGTGKDTAGTIGNIKLALKGAAGGNGTGMNNVMFDSRVDAGEFEVGASSSSVNAIGNVGVKVTGFGGASRGLNSVQFFGDTIGKMKLSVIRGGFFGATGDGAREAVFSAVGSIGAMTFDGDVTDAQVSGLHVTAGGGFSSLTVKGRAIATGAIVDSSIIVGQALTFGLDDKANRNALKAASLGRISTTGAVTGLTLVSGADIGPISIGGDLGDSEIIAGGLFGADGMAGGGDDAYHRAASIASIIVKGKLSKTTVSAGIDPVNGVFGDEDDVLAVNGGTLTDTGSIGAVTLTVNGGVAPAGAIAHVFAIQAASIRSLKTSSGIVKVFETPQFLDEAPAGEDENDVLIRVLPSAG